MGRKGGSSEPASEKVEIEEGNVGSHTVTLRRPAPGKCLLWNRPRRNVCYFEPTPETRRDSHNPWTGFWEHSNDWQSGPPEAGIFRCGKMDPRDSIIWNRPRRLFRNPTEIFFVPFPEFQLLLVRNFCVLIYRFHVNMPVFLVINQ